MCDNMPFDKVDVTCPYCWWRGKRHPYWRERKLKTIPAALVGEKTCPRCFNPVSDGWIFKTADIPDREQAAIDMLRDMRLGAED